MAKPKIDPQLAGLVVPITQVKPLEGNPRRGDVEAIKASYARFGQRKPIVARKGSQRVGRSWQGTTSTRRRLPLNGTKSLFSG